MVCAQLKPGEYFGEMALLNQATRGATVRCTTPMDALSLPKREFGLLTKNLPELKQSFQMIADRRRLQDIERDRQWAAVKKRDERPSVSR